MLENVYMISNFYLAERILTNWTIIIPGQHANIYAAVPPSTSSVAAMPLSYSSFFDCVIGMWLNQQSVSTL